MPRPTIGSPEWGDDLNADLDHIESLATTGSAAATAAASTATAAAESAAASAIIAEEAAEEAANIISGGSSSLNDLTVSALVTNQASNTNVAMDSLYAQVSKRPVHAADYGVSSSSSNNTTALENAIAAAAGVSLHLPGGVLTSTKAGRITLGTAPTSGLTGDAAMGTTLQFTNAAGGLDVGNGTDIIYLPTLSDMVISGNSAAATPLRIRKCEEGRFSHMRVQSATTACVEVSGNTNLTYFDLFETTNAPIGFSLGANATITFSRGNHYGHTAAFDSTGTGITSLVIDKTWVENCQSVLRLSNASAAGWGRFLMRDSHVTSTATNGCIARATGTSVAFNPGMLEVRDSTINLPSTTTPMIDFTAVNNSSATLYAALRDLTVTTFGGSAKMVQPHASQSWPVFYVEIEGIRGVATSRWAPTHGVTGGVRIKPFRLHDVGTPEGVITAPVGSEYLRSDGGASTSFYIKESGTGNTGWVAGGTGGGGGTSAYTTRNRVYTSPPAAGTEGYDTLIDLAYNTADTAQPESFMFRVWSTAVGTLLKSFWINESGLPRAWAVRKEEPALKLHAYSDNTDSPVLEVRGKWNTGATRHWGISGKGAPLLGVNQIIGSHTIVLAAADPVPAGLPANTVIVRI